MRAVEPAETGSIAGPDGVRLAYDVFGAGDPPRDLATVEVTCRAVRAPMLIVHGTQATRHPIARSRRLAELTGAPLVEVDGADHMIPRRHPVPADLLIAGFIRTIAQEGVR